MAIGTLLCMPIKIDNFDVINCYYNLSCTALSKPILKYKHFINDFFFIQILTFCNFVKSKVKFEKK